MTTYEEWRVTGSGAVASGVIWSTRRGDADPEAAARAFVERETTRVPHLWTDGPHLHKRTVTVSEWTEVDA